MCVAVTFTMMRVCARVRVGVTHGLAACEPKQWQHVVGVWPDGRQTPHDESSGATGQLAATPRP